MNKLLIVLQIIAVIKRLFRKELPIKGQVKALKLKVEEPDWLSVARKEIGTAEIPGPINNKRVIEYHMETSLGASNDEVSWCSSFINFCFMKAGIDGTDSAAARSWTKWGVPLTTPEIGCVVVFWRVSPKSWQGHVGFYLSDSEDGKSVYVLGGNQSDMVRVSKYKKERILSYRWPSRRADAK